MPLTAEERAEIRRQNGRKSRGPITDEGKQRSRCNSLKHGLRAEVLPLPDEDPEAVRARQETWQDYYQPRSPAAQHLVNQCVRATLLADRCDAYHHAALSRQIRLAEDRWEDERADEVGRLKDMLADDPATAVRFLKRSGHGCRWLITRWEALGAALEDQGFWRPEERAEAIRLLGEHPEPLRTTVAPQLNNAFGHPEPERSRYAFDAFAIHLCSLACQPDRSPKDLDRLMEPGRMPYAANGGNRLAAPPDPAECLAELRRAVADELEKIRPLEERLSLEIDEPDRADAAHRALVLEDPGEARLFLRYHAEARTSFHRAFKELTRTLKDVAALDPDVVAKVVAEEQFREFILVGPPGPAETIPPPANERERAGRRTWETYMRNVGWPNGETAPLAEVYRRVGLLAKDWSPNEPEAAPAISPNEPEVGGLGGPSAGVSG